MDRIANTTEALDARRKYAEAFDATLLKMWAEKQRKLFPPSARALRQQQQYGKKFNYRKAVKYNYKRFNRARRTGKLILSTEAAAMKHSADYSEVTFMQHFLDYGIYVDAGTGREVPRGNPGDIGRCKVRKPKPWFSRKYYMSMMNLRDFYAENLGLQAIGIIANALDSKKLRDSVNYAPNGAYIGPGANFTHGLSIPGVNMPL